MNSATMWHLVRQQSIVFQLVSQMERLRSRRARRPSSRSASAVLAAPVGYKVTGLAPQLSDCDSNRDSYSRTLFLRWGQIVGGQANGRATPSAD